MIETRFIIWEIIMVSYAILYPFVRLTFAREKPSRLLWRNFVISSVFIILLHIQYLVDTGIEFLNGFAEFQFIEILVVVLYQYNNYAIAHSVESERIESNSPNRDVINRIQKTFSGTNLGDEELNSSKSSTFYYKNAYQSIFHISVEQERSKSVIYFIISSVPNRFIQIINLIGLYLSTKTLETTVENPTGQENIPIPLFTGEIDAVLGILSLLTLSILLFVVEIQSAQALSIELPLLYKTYLQKLLLEKLEGKSLSEQVEGSEDYQSELEKARERAKNILETRKTDVLNKKTEQLKTKMNDIFENDQPPLDEKTLEQVRLVKAVQRILQSTPPWTKVSLQEIADKASGEEKEVELIISNLRASGEVSGIYDIWTQTYSGAKQSQWYITELLKDITGSGKSDVDHITIHPDGSAEISVDKKKKTTRSKSTK